MVWSCMPRTVICMTSFCRRLAICASTPGAARSRTARLILETVDAMASAWSIERVGVRLGPSISLYGMGDNDPLDTFSYVVRELDRRRIGCLTLLKPNEKDRARRQNVSSHDVRRLIADTRFDKAKGIDILRRGDADAIAYGSLYNGQS